MRYCRIIVINMSYALIFFVIAIPRYLLSLVIHSENFKVAMQKMNFYFVTILQYLKQLNL